LENTVPAQQQFSSHQSQDSTTDLLQPVNGTTCPVAPVGDGKLRLKDQLGVGYSRHTPSYALSLRIKCKSYRDLSSHLSEAAKLNCSSRRTCIHVLIVRLPPSRIFSPSK
jgi:hypothetical protein